MNTNAELYEQDFYAWTQATAALVQAGTWHEIAPGCLTEELRDLGSKTLLGQPFTLCDHLAFTPNGDGDDGDMTVALSPQGEVVFRAWLRQRGLDPLVCRS